MTRTHGNASEVMGESRRRGTRGERWKVAVSPAGSTHRPTTIRVANDEVATSRARLHDGHEAPLPYRPQPRADGYNHNRRNSPHAAQGPPFTNRWGPPRAEGCMDSFGEEES